MRIREILDDQDPAFKAAYLLLRRSFHRGERVSESEWRSSMRERGDKLWTDVAWHLLIAERDGTVVGIASGTYLGNVNLGVIGYLTTADSVRSLGLGSRLRARLLAAFERDARRIRGVALEGIVGEVSATNPWLRTLAKRPSVLVLDFTYYQPRLRRGDKPSRFLLYYDAIDRKRDRLPANELRRILYTVWRRVYRVSRPLERPAFRAMLKALQGRRMVGRLVPFKESTR